MAFRILTVDDEEAIRIMLQRFLNSLGYETDTADDGVAALQALQNKTYDLVLSDINMPRMKGFELLQKIKALYPNVKRALITAYDVDEYLQMALHNDVGNIIPKTTPFGFDEFKLIVHSLLTEDFFGLEHYLEKDTHISKSLITSHDQIEQTADTIAALMPDLNTSHKLNLVLNEILTNAVYYGARNEQSSDKGRWNTKFKLPPELAVHAYWASDNKKFAFSVIDNAGKLRKQDVLQWLCRQTEKDEQGLPKGVLDFHGRGFFIARCYIDALIINIKAGKKTEIIGLWYHKKEINRHKPLYINEI